MSTIDAPRLCEAERFRAIVRCVSPLISPASSAQAQPASPRPSSASVPGPGTLAIGVNTNVAYVGRHDPGPFESTRKQTYTYRQVRK